VPRQSAAGVRPKRAFQALALGTLHSGMHTWSSPCSARVEEEGGGDPAIWRGARLHGQSPPLLPKCMHRFPSSASMPSAAGVHRAARHGFASRRNSTDGRATGMLRVLPLRVLPLLTVLHARLHTPHRLRPSSLPPGTATYSLVCMRNWLCVPAHSLRTCTCTMWLALCREGLAWERTPILLLHPSSCPPHTPQTPQKDGPLHRAARDGQLEVVHALLKGGAAVNQAGEVSGARPIVDGLPTCKHWHCRMPEYAG